MSSALTLRPVRRPGRASGLAGEYAEFAALGALLNTFLRESGEHDPRVAPGNPAFQVRLPAAERVLFGLMIHWSPMGHHIYGSTIMMSALNSGEPYQASHQEIVEALLTQAASAASADSIGALVEQIADSVRRVTRYLDRDRPVRPIASAELTRYAEQSLLLGHPMHPAPKSAEGFSDQDAARYAPELGARFQLHYFAITPELLHERRAAPGPWIPDAVSQAASGKLVGAQQDFQLLPVHPWQAQFLRTHPKVRDWEAGGKLLALGPLGAPVYPTSSVRTVCDPAFPAAWKLPLHVRLTNFYRTNPYDHIQRATDASRLLGALRETWTYPGFEMLIETGYRTVADPELTADMAVLFRENPFVESSAAPQVVAALLEQRPRGEPDLAGYVRQAAGADEPRAPVDTEVIAEWLRRYLAISILPVLTLWTEHGVSLEAHAQNSLVHLQGGWPVRGYVRDMEGVSVSSPRWAADELLTTESPLRYDESDAWQRLRYYLITNHLGQLVHVLSRCGLAEEKQLWGVVADALAAEETFAGQGDHGYLLQLRQCPALPAKANLLSRLAQRSETPLYIDLPNPMREVSR